MVTWICKTFYQSSVTFKTEKEHKDELHTQAAVTQEELWISRVTKVSQVQIPTQVMKFNGDNLGKSLSLSTLSTSEWRSR